MDNAERIRKRLVATLALIALAVPILFTLQPVDATTWTYPATYHFGFQNSAYLNFDVNQTFATNPYQTASSNASFPGYRFFKSNDGLTEYGFYVSGGNVTVNNIFESSNVLDLATDTVGSVVKVYRVSSDPVNVNGGTWTTSDYVTTIITSNPSFSVTWQTSTSSPGGGPVTSSDTTPTIQPTPSPSEQLGPTPSPSITEVIPEGYNINTVALLGLLAAIIVVVIVVFESEGNKQPRLKRNSVGKLKKIEKNEW